ncbi:MAG: GC-type dockerin domain-anchored protein [Phycisphaerales bacterium JB059]
MCQSLQPLLAFGVALGALCATGVANDDANLLTNPGFEDAGLAGLPLGFQGINMDGSNWVDSSDPDGFVRSGSKSIKIEPAEGPGQAFQALTTNLFLPDGSDLYDPDYEYLGGDVHIIGYYLVPEGQTLANDAIVGVKLEFRREPPNFSVYTSVEFAVPQNATAGEWVEFHATFTDADMLAVGDFPPYATSLSVLPFRFWDPASGMDPEGTIYWDDLCLIQGDLGGCNEADLAEPYDALDFSDVLSFLTAFGSQEASADLAAPFGVWDFSDVLSFLGAFGAGCP